MRKQDEVLRDAPITTVALKFKPRYWYLTMATTTISAAAAAAAAAATTRADGKSPPPPPRTRYYECITLARRLLLTSVALMFTSLSYMTIFVFFLTVITLIIDKECEPYQRRWTSAFMYFLDWQLVFFIEVR